MAKSWRITATDKIAPGATLNISLAQCGNFGKIKDPVTGKLDDGIDYANCIELAPGQTIEVDSIEFPERFHHAIEKGFAIVEKLGSEKPKR